MANDKNEPDLELELEDEIKSNEPEIQIEDEPEKVIKKEDPDVKDPSAAIAELRRKLNEAEGRAKAAQDSANAEAARANKANIEVEDTNLRLIDNAISMVRTENDILKSNMRVALASGDHDRVAEIQESMSINAAKLVQLENGRDVMQTQAQAKREAPSFSDPLDSFKSKVSARSAAWADQNPEFIRNPRLFQKVVAAHNLVTADGAVPDTNEYFEAVENILGINRSRHEDSPDDSALSSAASPTQRRSAPAAAPVSRSPGGNAARPNVVRLSAAEREMAKMMNMTDKEYAVNKIALQKEGKMG